MIPKEKLDQEDFDELLQNLNIKQLEDFSETSASLFKYIQNLSDNTSGEISVETFVD